MLSEVGGLRKRSLWYVAPPCLRPYLTQRMSAFPSFLTLLLLRFQLANVSRAAVNQKLRTVRTIPTMVLQSLPRTSQRTPRTAPPRQPPMETRMLRDHVLTRQQQWFGPTNLCYQCTLTAAPRYLTLRLFRPRHPPRTRAQRHGRVRSSKKRGTIGGKQGRPIRLTYGGRTGRW